MFEKEETANPRLFLIGDEDFSKPENLANIRYDTWDCKVAYDRQVWLAAEKAKAEAEEKEAGQSQGNTVHDVEEVPTV